MSRRVARVGRVVWVGWDGRLPGVEPGRPSADRASRGGRQPSGTPGATPDPEWPTAGPACRATTGTAADERGAAGPAARAAGTTVTGPGALPGDHAMPAATARNTAVRVATRRPRTVSRRSPPGSRPDATSGRVACGTVARGTRTLGADTPGASTPGASTPDDEGLGRNDAGTGRTGARRPAGGSARRTGRAGRPGRTRSAAAARRGRRSEPTTTGRRGVRARRSRPGRSPHTAVIDTAVIAASVVRTTRRPSFERLCERDTDHRHDRGFRTDV